jgi:hypothetical protein
MGGKPLPLAARPLSEAARHLVGTRPALLLDVRRPLLRVAVRLAVQPLSMPRALAAPMGLDHYRARDQGGIGHDGGGAERA